MLSLHQLALSFATFHDDHDDHHVMPDPPPPSCLGLKATNFVPYFDYEGDLAVTGNMIISPELGADKSGMTAYGSLSGLDTTCMWGPDTSISANSCGIHIHEGSSCTEDAGGHFYNTAEDPWGAGYYMADGDSADVGFALMPGTSSADIVGKAVIVHDYNGGRIGCALLATPMAEQIAAPFSKYFSAEAELSDTAMAMSFATIYTTPDATIIQYQLMGVDSACTEGPDLSQSANSCGIHIHEGDSCDEDALGHYYLDLDADPWGAGFYETDPNGAGYYDEEGIWYESSYASGDFALAAGLSQADIAGKTLIVHNQAGGRTHCAPINAPMGFLGVGAFSPYPGYEGSLAVTGGVKMSYVPMHAEAGGSAVLLEALLVGVDPRCESSSEAANGCGVHIHEGYDCSDADTIGGHLYSAALDFDPWAEASYYVHSASDPYSTASTWRNELVFQSMGVDELVGRAFVVHDFDGARIACGIVAPPAEAC